MSIFSAMRYCLGAPSDYANLWAALALQPLGLFFDFMDGKVARWRGKASLMGQELDSLADLVHHLPSLMHSRGLTKWRSSDLLRHVSRSRSIRHRTPYPP